jgi:hypothetical protein
MLISIIHTSSSDSGVPSMYAQAYTLFWSEKFKVTKFFKKKISMLTDFKDATPILQIIHTFAKFTHHTQC